jgi:hypothetical protein
VARQTNAVEFNNFVAGLITEASPLNFPTNASLVDKNFVLKRDGSRWRRMGLDTETGSVGVTTSISSSITGDVAVTTFRWSNAGGDPNRTLLVVQVGTEVKIFNSSTTPLSAGLVYTTYLTPLADSVPASFAVVDGILVVASGSADILYLTYDGGVISQTGGRLRIRDFFGLEDKIGLDDLRSGSGVSTRPSTLTNAHRYNLRNQTFAESRSTKDDDYSRDTIAAFHAVAGVYPSNSDLTTNSVYPDTEAGSTSNLFWPENAIERATGTTPTAKGYFIIDALNRGNSRLEEYAALAGRERLAFPLTDIPTDFTPGGATCVAEFAGRVFYSGFPGDVIGGDNHSPRMSSYVLFSRLVDNISDTTKCYQDGDPTSLDEPDLIDTDGGFLRIDGAYGVKKLVNIGSGLIVVASNGVWLVQGGAEYGFKATNYTVSKTTSYGCISHNSIVQVDDGIIYWSEDGIYVVSKNQFGDQTAESLSQKTIQRYYDSIDAVSKTFCTAVYDSLERKVYWTYNNRLGSTGPVQQLVYDIALGAFYVYEVGRGESGTLPMLTTGVTVPPYSYSNTSESVTVSSDPVVVLGESVSVDKLVSTTSSREVVYIALDKTGSTIKYHFCTYSNQNYTDWASIDGVGQDAKGTLLTGWMSGGDTIREKQTPYVLFHFSQTETGFDDDFNVSGESSCFVSAQWGWSDSEKSGRWSKPFQAYRLGRRYYPANSSESFDNGFGTVTSKNKIRGKGKVVSLLIETEPKKDCRILGWGMVLMVNGNV